MLPFNPDRIWQNVRQATTEDLLDRVTVYRPGMEPEAVEIVEAELRARGVREPEIEEYARERGRDVINLPDGTARECSFCRRPAMAQGWGWHRLWGLAPVFPRYFYYCEQHWTGPSRRRDASDME
jgi:hypothetical protein